MRDGRREEFEGEDFVEGGEVREEELSAENECYMGENGTETISASSPNKRIDRLRALPDSLLIRILSKLGMKGAAMTSVLSKRWQFLWTELPMLEFHEQSSDGEKIRNLVTRVHRALVLRSGNYLEKLKVDFKYDESFASDVDVWVEFVVKNKVKEVTLLLDSDGHYYTLPQMMCSNSSLTYLSMRGCIIAPQRTIEWQSLTSLRIEKVQLPQHVLEKILSGCPVLSRLGLSECWGFSHLEANSQSLCALSVLDIEEGTDEPLLEISAPYVRSLDISLCPKGRKLRLTNIPSLVRSYFRLCGNGYDTGSEEVMSNVKEVLENILQHVEELELGWGSFKVLSKLVVNGWHLPQSRLRDVLVDASTDEQSFSGIVGLLESSPSIEELSILGSCYHEESISWSPAARDDLNCDLLHLKSVYMTDFAARDGEPMLRMARILLKRAIVLEKMEIDLEHFVKFSSTPTSDFIVKINRTLHSYPRSSQEAVIILQN